jgi:hypothetical protein
VKEVSCSTAGEQLEAILSQIRELVDTRTNSNKQNAIDTTQILILLAGSKAESCLAHVDQVEGYKLSALDNKARFAPGIIHFSTVSVFKGLEVDIVFFVIPVGEDVEIKLTYTSSSRAKFLLSIIH